MKLVKICGITTAKETDYLNEALPDFAGFVQFFPKSRRNIPTRDAAELLKLLDPRICPVAVTVSPDREQVREMEAAGFRALQVHGTLSEEVLESVGIPVIRAFNVSDLSELPRYEGDPRVMGFIFDAAAPGSGKVFDWEVLKNLPGMGSIGGKGAYGDSRGSAGSQNRTARQFRLLAGGLTPENVAEALRATGLDGADTSSGVEMDDGRGKSRVKILAFVEFLRNACSV